MVGKNISLKYFAFLIFGLEAIIVLFYGIFVRMQTTFDNFINQRYTAFQDTNVMMLIGFGFLMTFIKTYALSALTYTFFINAAVMQLYILIQSFWARVFGGFRNFDYYIFIEERLILDASYCVASILIAFGGFIGRVGPRQLLIAAVIQVIGYSFNQVICINQIFTFDAGGSATIHAFGAYFGLTVSWMLNKKIPPTKKAESNSRSNTIAMIGTLFLWMYWPSFNYGAYANRTYQQNQIVVNTLYSLTGSCLSTFMTSALLGNYLVMEDILNATLAGGVIIGTSSGFLYHPALAIAIGIVGGVISTLGFHFLTPILQKKLKIYDTCGIHNLHAIPGVLGGIISAIIMASYQNGFDPRISAQLSATNNPVLSRHGSFLNQGGLQLAATVTSVAVGIAFGLLTGFILNLFYSQNPQDFYEDRSYIKDEGSELMESRNNEENDERLLAP